MLYEPLSFPSSFAVDVRVLCETLEERQVSEGQQIWVQTLPGSEREGNHQTLSPNQREKLRLFFELRIVEEGWR